jgi:murein DD-endopeptidase MepM/ murein hydrolase activator NlpD
LERSALNRYRLPVLKNLLERVDRTSSPLHTGNLRNAIDFIVSEDTPVLAAANGIVTSVKDDSTIGGPNPIYLKYTNFITIMHGDEEYSAWVPEDTPVLAAANGIWHICEEYEEYSRYDHLAPRNSKVKVGQTVSEGQEIAKVGMTGYTFLPHLHFQIFIFTGSNIWIDFDTVTVEDFIS